MLLKTCEPHAGDFDPAEMQQTVETEFGRWQVDASQSQIPPEAPTSALPDPPIRPQGGHVLLIDRPDATQVRMCRSSCQIWHANGNKCPAICAGHVTNPPQELGVPSNISRLGSRGRLVGPVPVLCSSVHCPCMALVSATSRPVLTLGSGGSRDGLWHGVGKLLLRCSPRRCLRHNISRSAGAGTSA